MPLPAHVDTSVREMTMSQATARLLMAIGAIVGTPLFATLLFIFFESTWIRADQDAFIAACVSTGFLFILGWIAIWRRAVSWTRFRRLMMAVSVFWSVGIATIVGYCAGELASRQGSFMFMFATVTLWWPIWIISTALIWRESSVERLVRDGGGEHPSIHCPACGYDLTGLYEARCPECGQRFTLDQLVALNRPDLDHTRDRPLQPTER
jgi:hypothetical protein